MSNSKLEHKLTTLIDQNIGKGAYLKNSQKYLDSIKGETLTLCTFKFVINYITNYERNKTHHKFYECIFYGFKYDSEIIAIVLVLFKQHNTSPDVTKESLINYIIELLSELYKDSNKIVKHNSLFRLLFLLYNSEETDITQLPFYLDNIRQKILSTQQDYSKVKDLFIGYKLSIMHFFAVMTIYNNYPFNYKSHYSFLRMKNIIEIIMVKRNSLLTLIKGLRKDLKKEYYIKTSYFEKYLLRILSFLDVEQDEIRDCFYIKTTDFIKFDCMKFLNFDEKLGNNYETGYMLEKLVSKIVFEQSLLLFQILLDDEDLCFGYLDYYYSFTKNTDFEDVYVLFNLFPSYISDLFELAVNYIIIQRGCLNEKGEKLTDNSLTIRFKKYIKQLKQIEIKMGNRIIEFSNSRGARFLGINTVSTLSSLVVTYLAKYLYRMVHVYDTCFEKNLLFEEVFNSNLNFEIDNFNLWRHFLTIIGNSEFPEVLKRSMGGGTFNNIKHFNLIKRIYLDEFGDKEQDSFKPDCIFKKEQKEFENYCDLNNKDHGLERKLFMSALNNLRLSVEDQLYEEPLFSEKEAVLSDAEMFHSWEDEDYIKMIDGFPTDSHVFMNIEFRLDLLFDEFFITKLGNELISESIAISSNLPDENNYALEVYEGKFVSFMNWWKQYEDVLWCSDNMENGKNFMISLFKHILNKEIKNVQELENHLSRLVFERLNLK